MNITVETLGTVVFNVVFVSVKPGHAMPCSFGSRLDTLQRTKDD
jgi:hypothetical protein